MVCRGYTVHGTWYGTMVRTTTDAPTGCGVHTHPQMNMPSRHAISGCATGCGGVMHHCTCPTGCRVGSMVHGTMLSTYHTYGIPYVGTTCTSTCRCTVSMHPQDVVCICYTGWHDGMTPCVLLSRDASTGCPADALSGDVVGGYALHDHLHGTMQVIM